MDNEVKREIGEDQKMKSLLFKEPQLRMQNTFAMNEYHLSIHTMKSQD